MMRPEFRPDDIQQQWLSTGIFWIF